ncbi:hypothetical protein NRH57_002293 [Providencia rettgeri]|nr:hypothetical protein [Providencia rettgeri]
MREVKPTQKPVPSSDIKDLFFNSGLLDIWATSLERKYIDRFGNCHLTAAGMEWLFKELVEKFKVDMNIAIVAAGYIAIDSFQQGADLPNNELTQRNHILRDETTGEYYRWDGDFPKQVLAGSTPESTGGIGKGAWVSVGDASLRGDLFRDGGASLIRHKKPYDGAVSRTAADYFNQEINIDDFGAKGDALLFNGEKNPNRTDDSNAIQNAIVQAWLHGGVKITATPSKSYYVAKTIYTLATDSKAPDAYISKFKNRRIQIFDFQGARFIGRDDTSDITNSFMESGYLKQDMTIGSVMGGEPEQHLTYGTSIHNVELNKFYRGFRFKNHIYGCVINNVITYDVQQVTYAERCFVSEWKTISAHGSYTTGLARYHFKDNTNIVSLESLAPSHCDVGYIFESSTEAVKMTSCGIEGYRTVGVKFIGSAYNLELDSCYLESDYGYAISAINMKHITVNNCWIYGKTTVFGELGDNVNIRWMPNNMRQSMTKIFDDEKASQYNLSDFYLENAPTLAATKLPVYDNKQAMNVHQVVTAYDPAIGINNSGVIGKIEQCNGLQPIKVNGRTSKGTGTGLVVGSERAIENTSDTSRTVIYNTGISYSNTQLIYVNISVAYADGTWNWTGFIVGDSLFKLKGTSSADIIIINSDSKLVVKTPALRGTTVSPLGGEIRII